MSALKALLDELASGDDRRAHAAVAKFADLDESSLEPLREMARTGNPDGRWWAVCALLRSPHARTEDLIPFLREPEPAVRQAVILGLAGRSDPAATAALVRCLEDPDPLAASLAVSGLVAAGAAAVPGLLELMETAPQRSRILALRALAEIKDHRAIPLMMKVLNEESALLQHWAKLGLERLGLDMVYIRPQ